MLSKPKELFKLDYELLSMMKTFLSSLVFSSQERKTATGDHRETETSPCAHRRELY